MNKETVKQNVKTSEKKKLKRDRGKKKISKICN